MSTATKEVTTVGTKAKGSAAVLYDYDEDEDTTTTSKAAAADAILGIEFGMQNMMTKGDTFDKIVPPSNGPTKVGGWIEDIAQDLGTEYTRDKARATNHSLQIPTGISIFDNHFGGLNRRSLNFILGAVGARKSGLARTIAYNAATQGHRVLVIPTEFTYQEELQIFAAMHADNPKFFTCSKGRFTVDKIHGTKLDEEAEKFLTSDVIPDMKYNLGGKLAILQPAPSRGRISAKSSRRRTVKGRSI